MREVDEAALHKKMQEIKGQYPVKTNWGDISVSLDPIPNYAGGKGCPDEIIEVRIQMPLLGINISIAVPILIELERHGIRDAKTDLTKYCERSISGEQISYTDIPFIVVGGNKSRFMGVESRQLSARFSSYQVTKQRIL